MYRMMADHGWQHFNTRLPREPDEHFAVLRHPVARYWSSVWQVTRKSHSGQWVEQLDRVLAHNRAGLDLWDCEGEIHFLDQHRAWPIGVQPGLFRLENLEPFLGLVGATEMPVVKSAAVEWHELVAERVTPTDEARILDRYAIDFDLWATTPGRELSRASTCPSAPSRVGTARGPMPGTPQR